MAKGRRKAEHSGIREWLNPKSGFSSTHNQKREQSRGRKRAEKRAAPVESTDTNGVVAEVFPKLASVRLDADGERVLCTYKRNAVFGLRLNPPPFDFDNEDEKWRERSPVCVGDRVKVERTGSTDGVITGVALRRNFIARPAPGRDEGIVHVLASNLDALCVVSAAREPEFSPGLVDRFLIAAEIQGIQPVICVNKSDLLAPSSETPWALYEALGYPVYLVSAHTGAGITSLHEALIGKRAVFAGHSGVGKTSLLNALLGKEIGKVGAVSDATGKGRHTTTGAVLVESGRDSTWVDTPGVREFGLLRMEPEKLAEHFPEFRDLPCTQRGCQHLGEEGCDAENLPRLASYRRIRSSLSEDPKG